MDREKVIKTLTDALTAKENYPWAKAEMSFEFIEMLLELLKEQEAVEPEVDVLDEIDRLYRCPKCHKHFFYKKQKYCDQCGQAVKWK